MSRFSAVSAHQRTVTTSFMEALLDGVAPCVDVFPQPAAGMDCAGCDGAVRAGALGGLCVAALRHRRTSFAKGRRASWRRLRGVGHQAVPASGRPPFAVAGAAGQWYADVQKWTLFFRTFNSLLFGVSSIAVCGWSAPGAERAVHGGGVAGVHRLQTQPCSTGAWRRCWTSWWA